MLRIRALYYGMIAEVDTQLGRLFEALKARRDWDDTLVIFTSDHGEMLGDHGLLGKGGFHAQSQHIPLIIRMPGGKAGEVSGFTSSADVFPTLLDLWQVDATHAPNGASASAGSRRRHRIRSKLDALGIRFPIRSSLRPSGHHGTVIAGLSPDRIAYGKGAICAFARLSPRSFSTWHPTRTAAARSRRTQNL
jgi:hypothetical protein